MKVLASILVLCCAAAIQAAPRIIGGSDAPDGKYPYVVSLRDDYNHICGGSIINKRWILSSANCVIVFSWAENGTIVAGSNKLNEGGQTYYAEHLIMHEDYHLEKDLADVGLIRVTQDIEFTDKVQPIALPTENFQKVDYPALIAAWGMTKIGSWRTNNLQEIQLNVISLEVCKVRWSQISHTITVTDAHLCTLNKIGEGICHNAVGSPLVADGTLIGIASQAKPCAVGEPDLFTRVYSYVDWISEEIEKYEDTHVL